MISMIPKAKIVTLLLYAENNENAHGHVDSQPDHEAVEENEHKPNRRSVRA